MAVHLGGFVVHSTYVINVKLQKNVKKKNLNKKVINMDASVKVQTGFYALMWHLCAKSQ